MHEESCMLLTFLWGCLGNAYSWLSYILFCSAFFLHIITKYWFMLFIPLQLLLKLGLILLLWCGFSGSCRSAEGDWLDFPPSGVSQLTLSRCGCFWDIWINRGKKEILENTFKCFFWGGTPWNITQTCVVSLQQLLKANFSSQQLVLNACAGYRGKHWGGMGKLTPFLTMSLHGPCVRSRHQSIQMPLGLIQF